MSTFVNKNHIQKRKEGKEERKNDWMDDTEDRPTLAATLLGGLLSPLRMGLHHTKGLWSVLWVLRMSLCASLLVLTVEFWSHILLPSHFPDQLCLPSQDWHLARIFRLVCPPAVWQLPRDSMCIYAFSLISWYKFFKVACQGQNCLAKRQQYCPCSTSHGENIILSLSLPCQVSVCIWHIQYVYYQLTTRMILASLFHTHTYTPHLNIPQKHQISNSKQSVLWEVQY